MINETVIARYDSNILRSSGKTGLIKPDSEGYRDVILGAFDCMASDGSAEYPMDEHIKSLFADSGQMQRLAKAKRLRGEANHPAFVIGMQLFQYLDRLREVRNELTSHHILQPSLSVGKDEHGKKIVIVRGRVKASGCHEMALENSLKNREEDTCFSLRSIVNFYFKNGKRINNVSEIITWDWVSEPGMNIASKYHSAGLLSHGSNELGFDITPEMLDSIDMQRMTTQAGMLSDTSISTTMIRDAAGWSKVAVTAPLSMGW